MSDLHIGILLLFGIGVLGGILGAWGFQRIRVPQVVGYIVIGLVLGETGLGIISQKSIAALDSFNLFALGIIGFLVGGELRLNTFKRYGRQYLAILLGEGLSAFVLVAIPTGALTYAVVRDSRIAFAVGTVFGAIASATDPASTVDVLWEYRARGVLTTSLIAIVALDDALAMTLYGFGTSAAQMLTGGRGLLLEEALRLAVELGGAVTLGVAGGFALNGLLRYSHQQERTLAMAIGSILLVIGLCATLAMDVILATMALGLVLTNLAPRRSKDLFALMRSLSTPIYVMFFVLIGARLALGRMPLWLWGLVALYVVGRNGGKWAGAFWGARLSHAAPAVQRYTGLGLFTQGGVAVGLSIMASQHLSGIPVTEDISAGDLVVFVVTATTLVMQFTGPAMVKLAIKRTDEAGKNVTEQDVIAKWTVAEVMDHDVPVVPEQEPLLAILKRFSQSDRLVYPVVGESGELVGVVQLETLKDVLPNRDTWDWLVAGDVAQPPLDKATPTTPLGKALEQMRELGIEQMPVVSEEGRDVPIGMLDRRHAEHRAGEELLRLTGTATAAGV